MQKVGKNKHEVRLSENEIKKHGIFPHLYYVLVVLFTLLWEIYFIDRWQILFNWNWINTFQENAQVTCSLKVFNTTFHLHLFHVKILYTNFKMMSLFLQQQDARHIRGVSASANVKSLCPNFLPYSFWILSFLPTLSFPFSSVSFMVSCSWGLLGILTRSSNFPRKLFSFQYFLCESRSFDSLRTPLLIPYILKSFPKTPKAPVFCVSKSRYNQSVDRMLILCPTSSYERDRS